VCTRTESWVLSTIEFFRLQQKREKVLALKSLDHRNVVKLADIHCTKFRKQSILARARIIFLATGNSHSHFSVVLRRNTCSGDGGQSNTDYRDFWFGIISSSHYHSAEAPMQTGRGLHADILYIVAAAAMTWESAWKVSSRRGKFSRLCFCFGFWTFIITVITALSAPVICYPWALSVLVWTRTKICTGLWKKEVETRLSYWILLLIYFFMLLTTVWLIATMRCLGNSWKPYVIFKLVSFYWMSIFGKQN